MNYALSSFTRVGDGDMLHVAPCLSRRRGHYHVLRETESRWLWSSWVVCVWCCHCDVLWTISGSMKLGPRGKSHWSFLYAFSYVYLCTFKGTYRCVNICICQRLWGLCARCTVYQPAGYSVSIFTVFLLILEHSNCECEWHRVSSLVLIPAVNCPSLGRS